MVSKFSNIPDMGDYQLSKAINYSTLKYLEPSQGGYPVLFAQVITGEINTNDEDTKSMQEGRIFHHALERPDDLIFFNEASPTGQLRTFVEALADGETEEVAFAMTDSKKFSLESFKKSLAENKDNAQRYFQFLNNAHGKLVLPRDESENLKQKIFSIYQNSTYQKYCLDKNNKGENVPGFRFRECEITLDSIITTKVGKGVEITAPVKCKIDHLYINLTKSGFEIVIIDYKKTAEKGGNFGYAIKKYGYVNQLSFYRMIVTKAIRLGLFNEYYPELATTPDSHIMFRTFILASDKYNICSTFEMYESTYTNAKEYIQNTLLPQAIEIWNNPNNAVNETICF